MLVAPKSDDDLIVGCRTAAAAFDSASASERETDIKCAGTSMSFSGDGVDRIEMRNESITILFVHAAGLTSRVGSDVAVVVNAGNRIVGRARTVELLIEWRNFVTALHVPHVQKQVPFRRVVVERRREINHDFKIRRIAAECDCGLERTGKYLRVIRADVFGKS